MVLRSFREVLLIQLLSEEFTIWEWELVHVFAHVITEWRLRIRAKHPNPRVSFFNLWEAFEELDGEPQSAE